MTCELEHFQSMWAMEDLPYRSDSVWTVDQQVQAIAANGFDGLAVDLGARRVADAPTVAALAGAHGLSTAVLAFVADDDELDGALTYAERIGARRMILCAKLFGHPPGRAGDMVCRWYRRAGQRGIELELETHRNTLTNDLRYTADLLDHLDPDIWLAVDLSHFVCGNEIPDDPEPEIETLIGLILRRAGSLQGRVATRCQVQVPLGYPQHRHWEDRFRQWWAAGFAAIRERGATAMFCTELGPRPYAWTDADGSEISDRWAEALTLKQWAAEAFTAADVKETTP